MREVAPRWFAPGGHCAVCGPRLGSSAWDTCRSPEPSGNSRVPCGAGDDHSPREQYAFPQSLPDDPRQVRARVRAFFHATDASETRTEHEYRALATIPGVRAADAPGTAGRDAIALYLYQEGPGPRSGLRRRRSSTR
ncbi:hypothetical protein SGLAM104S_01338 [Streptomyces glaucescens]